MPLVRRSVFSLRPRGAGASSMARPLGRIRPATQAADRQPLVRARLHFLRTKISLSPDKKRERNHRQHKEYPAENEPTATSDGISRIVANIVTQSANQKAPATECTQPKCQKPTKDELTWRKVNVLSHACYPTSSRVSAEPAANKRRTLPGDRWPACRIHCG